MDSDECENCLPGLFTDERDLDECDDCPKGYYTNDKPSKDHIVRLNRCEGCPRDNIILKHCGVKM